MHKAIEEANQLPPTLLNTLYGDNCPFPATGSEAVNQSIDPGCAQYLEGLENSSAKVDKPQLEALRSALSTIGECKHGSSSTSLVHGPPGTGKTTTILHLIGALLHHSLVGHVGREQKNGLKSHIPKDNIKRYRETPGGIRILVCAPSNKGLDNILDRLHREGIPDGKGGKIWPQTARITRANYDQGNLYMHSVDQKALPFDQYIHNVGAGRNIASSKARKSFFRECIIVLTTLVSSGGARFRGIKEPFDIVIIDEIGQAGESETLVPLTNVSKRSGRCHLIAVEDHHQLPPIAHAQHAMKSIRNSIHFHYDKQMVSIFERLYSMNRAPSSMLSIQYRMCRAIADMNNMIFYNGALKSTLPESVFDAPYNMGWDPASGCFARMTWIDTSPLSLRAEIKSKDGDYRNTEEISIVDEILHKIKMLSGETFPQLRGQIAVLVPYRSQVSQMRLVLERTRKYVPHGVSREGFDILVDSDDSMQGSERTIIIFGTTRSNRDQNVGFLEQANRLNVATSRAKKLQISIGDMSTLGVNHRFCNMESFSKQDRKDVAYLELHESKSGYILDGLKQVTSRITE